MSTLAILVCCKRIFPYRSSFSKYKIIGTWNNDNCYYVSNHDFYSIKKYDILSDKHYFITQINIDTAIVSLSADNKDSLLYMVKLPISYKEYVGYVPDAGGGLAEIEAFRRIMHTIHFTSIFCIYDVVNSCWQYETTFTARIINIMPHPSDDCVIINIVIYSERRKEKISDSIFFQVTDFSVYAFNLINREFSILFEHAFALGYLPDSSLLLYQKDSNHWRLVTYKNSHVIYFSECLPLVDLLPKIHLLPFTYYLSWYESGTNTVRFYNIMNNRITSISARSDSYCISPDASQILFFVMDQNSNKVKIIPAPTGVYKTTN